MRTYAYDSNHKLIDVPGNVDCDPITIMECMAETMNGNDYTLFVDEADIGTVPEGVPFFTYPTELHLELPPNNRINGIWKFEVNGKKYRGNMRFTRMGAAKLQYIKQIH